ATGPATWRRVPCVADELGLEQVTVPPPIQFAVHVDFSRSCGRLAAKAMASCCESQLSEAAVGGPRIAARVSSVRGARPGVWAKQTEEMRRTAHASNEAF